MSTLESIKNPVGRSRAFLEECWAELKKVHWPTRKETQGATVAVVIAVLIVSLYLGLVDLILSWFLQVVLS